MATTGMPSSRGGGTKTTGGASVPGDDAGEDALVRDTSGAAPLTAVGFTAEFAVRKALGVARATTEKRSMQTAARVVTNLMPVGTRARARRRTIRRNLRKKQLRA